MKNKNDGGFIKITILIIIGLVVLKYVYDIDVIDYIINVVKKIRS